MDETRLRLEGFFAAYAARFNAALRDPNGLDVEATAGAFADYFVEAGPAGVHGGKNDDTFRARIPIGYGFYRSIGTTAMDITSLELTSLDEYHWMARVHWDSRYAREGGGEVRIEFDVIYFLQVSGDEAKIFAYVTGDEEKALQERGLMPG